MSISLSLVVRHNNYQAAQYNDWTYTINGYFAIKKERLTEYFSLQSVNKNLSVENVRLKNEIEFLKKELLLAPTKLDKKDNRIVQYNYTEAKVVFNSVNKQYNYLIIDKGEADGIKPEMAVVVPDGIVGIVESVSEHYASVIPALNRNFKLSAKFKKNNYFGSFEWSGKNYRIGALKEIPLHVDVQKGDTIITSGYSAIFPEGIPVGLVDEYERKDGNFFNISLILTTDFKNLNYVYLITNNYKENQKELEKSLKND